VEQLGETGVSLDGKGRGVVCRYSRLQGGSPHLCRLRIIHSESLNEHLIMY
jgi:hypothetical protein